MHLLAQFTHLLNAFPCAMVGTMVGVEYSSEQDKISALVDLLFYEEKETK